MATISVGPNSYVRPYRKVRIKHFRVQTSQTIRRGDLMVLDTTADQGNRVKKSGADPTTDRGIVGFAAEAITTDSTGSTADVIPIWLATGEAEFIAHCENAGAIDNDDISVEYGMVNDATNNIWRVDRTEVTAKLVRVLELYDAHADVNGRFVFMMIAPERLYHD